MDAYNSGYDECTLQLDVQVIVSRVWLQVDKFGSATIQNASDGSELFMYPHGLHGPNRLRNSCIHHTQKSKHDKKMFTIKAHDKPV